MTKEENSFVLFKSQEKRLKDSRLFFRDHCQERGKRGYRSEGRGILSAMMHVEDKKICCEKEEKSYTYT